MHNDRQHIIYSALRVVMVAANGVAIVWRHCCPSRFDARAEIQPVVENLFYLPQNFLRYCTLYTSFAMASSEDLNVDSLCQQHLKPHSDFKHGRHAPLNHWVSAELRNKFVLLLVFCFFYYYYYYWTYVCLCNYFKPPVSPCAIKLNCNKLIIATLSVRLWPGVKRCCR